ncbi:MAG: hypothetical protein U0175_02455 [Caldilineaceae bacterium]
MKGFKRFTTFAVMLSLLLSITAGIASAQSPDSAEDLPGQGWYTGVQLQNVGTATANITVEAFANATGGATFTKTDTIAQNGAKTYLPHDLTISGGFQGSARVSASQPLNAIVNLTNRKITVAGNEYGVDGGLAAAQYQGVNTANTELNFPLVKRNHFGKTTTFYIQNAGTSATTATATFKVAGSATPLTFQTPSIEPGRMYIVNPSAANVPDGNGVSVGSLTVTSDNGQPLAGVVVEHGSENPATQLQSTRGFTPNDRGATAYAPIIKSEFFNRFTGLQVQNVGTAAVDVTVTYKGAGGSCAGQTFTASQTGLAAGDSHTFVHLSGSAGNTMPSGCLASATISAPGGNIVAIVNEAYVPSFLANGGNGGRNESTTYSAQKSGGAKLSAPLYKENSFNKGTGLQVQNVSDSDANVVVTFTNANGTSYKTQAQTITPGSAFTFVEMAKKANLFDGTAMPSDISGSAGVFGVIITSNQPVVAIANESTYPFGNSPLQQDKNNYEAFVAQ